MQLGTSWRFGTAVPAAVPDAFRQQIALLESTLVDAQQHFWKLTWLEAKPVVSLGHIVTLVLDSSGNAVWGKPETAMPLAQDAAAAEDADDDWLS